MNVNINDKVKVELTEKGFADSLTVVTKEQASKMHRCRKCFKDE